MTPTHYRPILLVEDNPDDVELTRRAFRRNRLANALVVCEDGAEALDYLFGRGAHAGQGENNRPALVLLDLKLPRVEGIEVLRAVRSDPRTATLPVVILTTSSEDKDIIDSYKLGANSYVRKPVAFNDFIEAVRQLETYWLVLNEAPPS
ncbi:MAG TPA: response regulator [Thermoanaerobaculia bacterium]|nr:response regulator [Thermoanaerobaculia bacterium]